MEVSKNRGTPKWMVKIMENPIKMDDLGVPPFKETSICFVIIIISNHIQHIKASNEKQAVKNRRNSLKPTMLLRWFFYMDVSENSGTPKSSILVGFSIVNHPFWGTITLGNPHIVPDLQANQTDRWA